MIPFFLWWVPLVKQELLILPQQTSSSLCRNHDSTLSTTSATSEAGNCLFFHSKQVHPCVVIMIPPFLWRVPLVKQELLILPQQTSSPLVFVGYVLFKLIVMWGFWRSFFCFLVLFLLDIHCIVCLIYIFWLSLWFLQTFLKWAIPWYFTLRTSYIVILISSLSHN
jgi:hypothetical protein